MKEAIKQRMAERKDKSDVKSASEDDIKLKKKTPSSAQKMVASPTHSPITTGMEMSPQNYEEAFNKIKAATNMSDINMLVWCLNFQRRFCSKWQVEAGVLHCQTMDRW